uniref:Uncharacterized protein n=1 Tax=Strigamia maritima TaxID=126957 RepID=T1JCJ6_STRMM
MVVIDWEELKNINFKNLNDDQVDKFYLQLSDVKIDDESDAAKLQKLFRLSQVIMQAKAVQAEVVMEELEKESSYFAKKEQKLINKNDDLLQQLREIQRSDKNGRRGSTDFRNDSQALQRANERFKYELKDAKELLAKEKAEAEKLLARLEDSEREKRDSRREIANLKDEINDYRHRMESQRDSLLQDKGRDNFSTEKMREKNQQINKLLEEIEALEKANDFLQHHVSDLKLKLEDATKEMNISTAELIRLKDAIQKSETITDNLSHDNKQLELRLEQILENSKQKDLSEEKIIEQLNQRLEDWKVKAKGKDLELKQYHKKITELEEKLAALYAAPDESKINILSKTLADRDEKIILLQEKVEKATKDLNENAKIIENLTLTPLTTSTVESKLKSMLKDKDRTLKNTLKNLSDADAYAQEKDKQLITALTRMHEYESGEYGLTEAISEIKNVKLQLKARDKQIQELTQSINNKDLILNQLLNENEELRERLGLDPRQALDVNEVKEKMMVRQQRDKWLNVTLQHEIEQLEEERVELRMQNRRLAQMAGERAAYMGMSVEDLQQLHRFSERLKSKQETSVEVCVESKGDSGGRSNVEEELKETRNQLQISLQDRTKLSKGLKDAMADIKHLEDGLSDVLNAIREHNVKSDRNLQCPSLEKLNALIESKQLTGSYDLVAFSKSQLDIERGKNEELRAELRRVRSEKREKKMHVEEIEDQFGIKSAVPKWRVLELPENLTLSTSDTIAVLNAQLLQVLSDLKRKAATNSELSTLLNECRQKITVFDQQQVLLYDEFATLEKEWKNEKMVLVEEKRRTDEINLELRTKVEEFEKICEIYSRDESEVRRRVAEMSGHFINSKSNEAVLNRKVSVITENENEMSKHIKQLQDELMRMDSATTQHVQYLRRSKEKSIFQISWLQKCLQQSVPAIDLEITTAQLESVTSRYEDICQKYAEANETSRLENEISELRKMLKLEEKERIELQVVLQKESREITRNNLLTVTEMQLANEKDRNEHLKQLHRQNEETIQQLNSRNRALEIKLDEVTKDGLNRTLDKLHSYETAQQRVKKLEENENKLEMELAEQKEISKIARSQAEAVNKIFKFQNDEIKLFRQQFLDMESNDSEKFKIGQLQRQVAALKKSEAMSSNYIDKFKTQLSELDVNNLRLEQKCDEKEQLLFTCRNENWHRIKLLLSVLHRLRRQNYGVGSFSRQKMTEIIDQLRENEKKVSIEREQAENERLKLEEKVSEYKHRLKYIEDLSKTLKDGDGEAKLIEWHEKVNVVRIREMKLQRENNRLKQELQHRVSLVTRTEAKLSEMDQEIVRLTNEMDKRDIEWENCLMTRITEEEQSLATTEKPKEPKQVFTSGQFQNENKAISRYRNENHNLHKKVSALLIKVKELEDIIISKDKSVSELHLKMSTASTQQFLNEQPTSDDEPEQQQQIYVLKSYVETLQLQLSQKEEMVKHYQHLLHAAQDEINANGKRHQTILQLLQNKLHKSNDATLEKFKNIVQQASEAATTEPVLIKTQIQKLEDTVAEQDIALRNVADKLNQCQSEKEEWRLRVDELEKIKFCEEEKMVEEYQLRISELESLLESQVKDLEYVNGTVEQLKQELQVQKEANDLAPSVLQQKCIEKLKEQVATKEKQLQGLSKAMTEVKAEIIAIAKEKAEPDLKVKEMGQRIRQLEEENKRSLREKLALQEEVAKMKVDLVLSRQDAGDNASTPEIDDKKQEEIQHAEKVNEQMIQWMEKKKWQKIVEQLKNKLKEQEKTKEQLEKKNKLLTSVTEKLNLEKKSLENKLKSGAKETAKQDNQAELRQQLMDLKVEKKHLESDLEFSQTEAIYLQDRIAELETTVKELQTKDEVRGEPVSPASGDFTTQRNVNTVQMEQKVQKLQEEITICQKVISDLKYEKANMKEKLADVEQKEMMDNNRIYALEKAAEKLMVENGKISKELKKEQQISDSLRERETKLLCEMEKFNQELTDTREHLKLVESKQQRFSTFEKKRDTATREIKLQQKIDSLQKELIAKNDKIKEINVQLRESTDHEKKLMREVSSYKKMINDKQNVKKV